MVEIRFSVDSPVSPASVLAAARDFSPGRLDVWPNVSAKGYEVHATGDDFAEVTEAALQGFLWERSRYEWSQPDSVHQTVLDSNALMPGSTWELTATQQGAGSRVTVLFRREFKRTAKGGFAWLVNRFAGSSVYKSDLRRALRAIEKQNAAS